jgi:hypothetical protein
MVSVVLAPLLKSQYQQPLSHPFLLHNLTSNAFSNIPFNQSFHPYTHLLQVMNLLLMRYQLIPSIEPIPPIPFTMRMPTMEVCLLGKMLLPMTSQISLSFEG